LLQQRAGFSHRRGLEVVEVSHVLSSLSCSKFQVQGSKSQNPILER
jgi:hypothetical protein